MAESSDGKFDVATLNYSTGSLVATVLLWDGGHGQGTQWATGGTQASTDKWFIGDLNGDGASDLAKVSVSGTALTAMAYLSTGNSFSQQSWELRGHYTKLSVVTIDVLA